MGDIKFGKNGEWAEFGMLQVQYHGIKSNAPRPVPRHGHADGRSLRPSWKPGKIIYPFEKARP